MPCNLSPGLFGRWMDGEISQRELFEALVAHLTELCPTCEEAWLAASRQRTPGSAWFRELQREKQAQGFTAEEAITRALRAVEAHKEDALQDRHRQAAEEHFARILALDPAKRSEQVAGLPADGASLVLARRLLEEGRRLAQEDAPASTAFAQLAALAARRPFEARLHRLIAADLRALAAAAEANGYRLLGQYAMAAVCIEEAYRLAEAGTGDPVTFADVLSYRASLMRDQNEVEQAGAFLRHAIAIYTKVGADRQAGRAYVQLATVHSDQGDPGKAAEATREALERLGPEAEMETVQAAYENLAFFVAQAGDPARAREIMAEHPSPARRPERFRLQREWQECVIASKLGEHAAATAGLERIRQTFVELEDAPNAATATLDLALVYGEAGQVAAMCRTAAEALPLLLPLGLPDEVLGTLMILQEAAQTQAVTAALLRQLHRDLRQPSTWREA